ncbi:S9 family peptidase [Ruania alba]|uniref:Dipeptidyl aminopeptidase/acylaminoacyl peptidase n=1 Tax=Ruania alba TaxID=648782 RepID=A0A1H5FLM8_9MICO|nr:S9 family peptidase [Ruania alba]SEE04084.1 Dipeptidyl aminopeptidase/acylaminoacyl peptidase [Ruania alba]
MSPTMPYGSWPSPLDAEQLADATVRLSEVLLEGGDTYWIESRSLEGGRSALVRHRDGRTTDVVTAAPDSGTFDVRTRVHEYGGAAYAVTDSCVVASRREDDRLYRIDLVDDGFAPPVPLVPADGRRYADLEIDRERALVYAVVEDHGGPGQYRTDPGASLVAIPLDGAAAEHRDRVITLVTGPDFVSSPRLSHDGALLAWITWEHPDMPWDSGLLHLGTVADGGGRLLHRRVIAGGPSTSVAEPLWTPKGDLVHVDDRSGWWNLYRSEFDAAQVRTRHLHPSDAEFTLPQWGFGPRTSDLLDEHHLMVSFGAGGRRRLGAVHIDNGALEAWDGDWEPERDVRAAPGRVVFIGASATQAQSVVELDLAQGQVNVLRSSSALRVSAESVSVAEEVSWPSEDGVAHGFLYRPTSETAQGPETALPPLLVLSHGGPTAASTAGFDPAVQFWTTRGFAVLDVNYGGSTGYGRAYRERLRGRWGIVDVADCASGARWLADRGIVDGSRMAVRGGSAGGFTTLAALTFTDVFAAGASHYGIGDLEALAEHTHKFESRYLDSLVGPYPDLADTYRARSPIHHTDQLRAPMILLQGTEDRVVPPAQAETMAAAVRAAGMEVEVHMFDGEGHGFRRAENKRAALEAELAFYGRVFAFTPA